MSRRKQLKPQQLPSPTGISPESDKLSSEESNNTNIEQFVSAQSETEKLSEESNTNDRSPFSQEQLKSCNNGSGMTENNNSDDFTVTETDIVGGSASLNSDPIMADLKGDETNEAAEHADDNKSMEEAEQYRNVADSTNLKEEESSTMHSTIYECDKCSDAFEQLDVFVQHKKQHERLEQESSTENNKNFNNMVDDSTEKDDVESNKNVVLESMDSTNVAVSQMTASHDENESVHEEEEDNFNAEEHENKMNIPQLPTDLKNSGFLSSNAIASVLQNVKQFESGLNLKQEIGEDGKPTGKLDINGIKDQVKMIQQQQAYQIQMLNYLHWQLAVLSSNPQAAIQHVASSMRNAIPGMPGQVPGMPPAMGPGGPTGMMPSMMAAMAMNGGNNMSMDMASKARMMMNMQNGNPHLRSMFGPGRTLSDENEGKHFSNSNGGFDPQHEQRYQLQEPPDMEKLAKMQHHENINMSPSKSEDKNAISSPMSSVGFENDSIHSRQKSSELKPHMNGHAEDLRRDNDCNSNNSFKDDESSENSAYRHRCKFCQKVFGSDSALQIHLRSHTGERPYKCNICGNRFTTKGNLKVHFMRHKAKYPHIPMNPHPVPEYLDGVPTPTGLPYGMSILPEKAVFERPRLHGNPSIHLNANISSSSQHNATSGVTNGMSPLSMLSAEQAAGQLRNGFPMNAPSDLAMLQNQMLERRKQMQMMEKNNSDKSSLSSPNPDKNMEAVSRDSKPSAAMLQMAMMPFFKFGKQGENEMLNSMLPREEQQHIGDVGNSDGRSSYSSSGSTSPPQRRHPSETSKLQRLVENIDRGRVLQKNECHMCHRVLSCQSALKLHYRTHTGERPHKCDLCSRAFTTRGNLRTHYSSVHRQQLRSLPPGGASRPGSYPCPLCHMRFFDVMEFQQHMRTHAIMQQKSQEVDHQADRNSPCSENEPQDVDRKQSNSTKGDLENSMEGDASFEGEENDLQIDEEDISRPSDVGEDNAEESQHALDLSSPASCERSNDEVTPHDANNNVEPMKMHKLNDNDQPQMNFNGSRDVTCEICEKTFTCNSALEIHMRNHTKERPYLCRICQKRFSTKGNLKQHLIMHNITDAPEELLEPVLSPDGRGSNSNSPHSSISPYNRDMMSGSLKRSFDSDSSGNGPAAKQRQFPRHWCHICQKQFSSASSLQIHTRTHTGEKPFACSVCGRAFTTKGNLKVHMGTHVFGAGGSRRGRRISMDNPLISPWMQNIANNGPAPAAMQMPPQDGRGDPTLLYQQYAAAIANGLLNGKSDRDMMNMNNNRLLAMNAAAGLLGQNNTSPSTSPQENGPSSPSRHRLPVNGMNNPAMAQAATEWFLKAYQQRTQEQVN